MPQLEPDKEDTWFESRTFKFAFHTRGAHVVCNHVALLTRNSQRGCVDMVAWTDDVSVTLFGAITDSPRGRNGLLM